ncbi:hypothetical protein [Clostridium pasteurianum]|uniref:Uncharacterized protein n=1 Tax=Clostridium pasteurianum BC1 TaxID=86416 RepID=R4K1I3_CLOPA|nr:hypothetical protein [Clostridium pasteurianum]AGK95621.1 hypothetical protein Clopa_0573 [Clostridium pasteurianum BC1]
MIKTIILDLAGLFIIGSAIYDMYVKHDIKKTNASIKQVNEECKKWIKENTNSSEVK